jgi:2-dehydropantoate 2-reductase
MKIAVIGAGAIGSVIGGLLSKAGEDVTLIGRKPHVDAIKQKGLILDSGSEKTLIQVKAAENLDFKPDLALLTVKTQDVESSVRKVQSYLFGVPVITVQNGVQSDDLVAAVLGNENVISGVVTFNGEFLEPGKVLYSNPFGRTALLIGEPFGAKGNRIQSYSSLLNKAMPTETSDDIRGAHWTKLIWNLQNVVPAMTGLPYQESYQNSKIRELTINLVKEAINIINKAGIKTADVPGFPLDTMKTIASMPLPDSSDMLKRIAESLGKVPVLGSMLQSIKRGKSTEVDYVNWEIVKLGKKAGVTTPANTLALELVHQVETTGKFLTIDELIHRLSSSLNLKNGGTNLITG